MAKTKYSPSRAKEIIEAVEMFGSDQSGYKVGDISKDTFYKWVKRYPDFADKIYAAKIKFRDNNSDKEIGTLALAKTMEMLREGKKIVSTTITPKSVKTRYDGAGEIIYQEVEQEKETTIIRHFPPSESLLKNCLPPLHIYQAIEMLEKAGYVVLNPNEPAQADKNKGISDVTYNKITGEILGVNSNKTQNGKKEENN